MALNHVVFEGNLADDPKVVRDGEGVLLRLCQNRTWKGREVKVWAGCAAWGPTAKYLLQYLKLRKGDLIVVGGELTSFSRSGRTELQIKANDVRPLFRQASPHAQHYAEPGVDAAEPWEGSAGDAEDDFHIPF